MLRSAIPEIPSGLRALARPQVDGRVPVASTSSSCAARTSSPPRVEKVRRPAEAGERLPEGPTVTDSSGTRDHRAKRIATHVSRPSVRLDTPGGRRGRPGAGRPIVMSPTEINPRSPLTCGAGRGVRRDRCAKSNSARPVSAARRRGTPPAPGGGVHPACAEVDDRYTVQGDYRGSVPCTVYRRDRGHAGRTQGSTNRGSGRDLSLPPRAGTVAVSARSSSTRAGGRPAVAAPRSSCTATRRANRREGARATIAGRDRAGMSVRERGFGATRTRRSGRPTGRPRSRDESATPTNAPDLDRSPTLIADGARRSPAGLLRGSPWGRCFTGWAVRSKARASVPLRGAVPVRRLLAISSRATDASRRAAARIDCGWRRCRAARKEVSAPGRSREGKRRDGGRKCCDGPTPASPRARRVSGMPRRSRIESSGRTRRVLPSSLRPEEQVSRRALGLRSPATLGRGLLARGSDVDPVSGAAPGGDNLPGPASSPALPRPFPVREIVAAASIAAATTSRAARKAAAPRAARSRVNPRPDRNASANAPWGRPVGSSARAMEPAPAAGPPGPAPDAGVDPPGPGPESGGTARPDIGSRLRGSAFGARTRHGAGPDERARVGVAIPGPGAEQPLQHRVERGRDRRVDLRRRPPRPRRQRARQQLVEGHAEREQVARASTDPGDVSCSGAMYAKVPGTRPVAVRAASPASKPRAMPRSTTTVRPPGPIRMFAGLTSRCTRPAAWIAPRPLRRVDEPLELTRASGGPASVNGLPIEESLPHGASPIEDRSCSAGPVTGPYDAVIRKSARGVHEAPVSSRQLPHQGCRVVRRRGPSGREPRRSGASEIDSMIPLGRRGTPGVRSAGRCRWSVRIDTTILVASGRSIEMPAIFLSSAHPPEPGHTPDLPSMIGSRI